MFLCHFLFVLLVNSFRILILQRCKATESHTDVAGCVWFGVKVGSFSGGDQIG